MFNLWLFVCLVYLPRGLKGLLNYNQRELKETFLKNLYKNQRIYKQSLKRLLYRKSVRHHKFLVKIFFYLKKQFRVVCLSSRSIPKLETRGRKKKITARKLQRTSTTAFRDSTCDEEASVDGFFVKAEFGKNTQKAMKDE